MRLLVSSLLYLFFFFFNDTATTEIYTLSLHDALPICLVWVRLATGEELSAVPALAALAALPAFEAEADAHLRKLNCGPYDVAASAPRIIENFLDMSHFGFVHEGWLGSREDRKSVV